MLDDYPFLSVVFLPVFSIYHLLPTVRVGRGLQCLQDEVCFLCFRLLARRCHTISSITVDPLPLTEPDKRLSHTSGSSVGRSVRLRSTTRVQVFAEPDLGPVHPGQCLFEPLPGVCLALALAVEPFIHNSHSAIDILVVLT